MIRYLSKIEKSAHFWQLFLASAISVLSTAFFLLQLISVSWVSSFPGNTGAADKGVFALAVGVAVFLILDLLIATIWIIRIRSVINRRKIDFEES